ncbi:response regulator transcription factor [Alphaproteobacteria bacterium]|nr:response regulator transcription factor [Alphaproteobacteria bacterium]
MTQTTRILFIDDDPEIQEAVGDYLAREGLYVKLCKDGENALKILQSEQIDIILLDLLLGEENGISILRKIRDTSNVPVIMISGKSEGIDRVIGIEAGADDYIAKPFLPRELSARIAAVLRRGAPPANKFQSVRQNIVFFGPWQLNRDQYQVVDQEGNQAKLSTKEFMILDHLIVNKDKALSRENLFKVLRDPNSDSFDRAVDIQINRIRTKLGDTIKNPKYIKTVRNIGYMFIADIK